MIFAAAFSFTERMLSKALANLPAAITRWIFLGNFFIATCAVLLVNETGLHFAHQGFPLAFDAFIFCAALCSYSLHTYLSDTSADTLSNAFVQKYRNVFLFFFITSALYCLVYIYKKPELWIDVGVLGILTFLYTAPKINRAPFNKLQLIAIGKTIYLALVWTLVTVWLPFRYMSAITGPVHYVYFAHKFFFVLTVSIMFDYRDKAKDQAQGIRSLVTYMSNRNVERWMVLTIILFIVSGGILGWMQFKAYALFALLIPSVLIYPVFTRSKKTKNDYFFLICADGLLIIPVLLLLLAGIFASV